MKKQHKPAASGIAKHKKIHHIKRLKKHVRLSVLVWGFRALAIFVLLIVLLRPVVASRTAAKLNFVGCVAMIDRKLEARQDQTFAFRVTSQTDDTFVLKKFGVREELKAHKSKLVTTKATAEPGWYKFKLERCGFASALPVLTDKGELPAFDKGDYTHDQHGSPSTRQEEHGTSHKQ